jgi:hypothetical protein
VELMRIWRTRVAAGCEDEYERFRRRAVFADVCGAERVRWFGFRPVGLGLHRRNVLAKRGGCRAARSFALISRDCRGIETTGFLVGDASLEVYRIFGSARGEHHEETRDKRAR